MFKRSSKPVEHRIQRVAEVTGRARDAEHEAAGQPQESVYRSSAPGPIPERAVAEPEPEFYAPGPGRDAPAAEHVSSLRQSVLQRAEDEPEQKTRISLGSRFRDRPDPLVFGAVVVIAVVIGLVLLPVLFRGGGKKATTAQNTVSAPAAPSAVAQTQATPAVRATAATRPVIAPSFAPADTPAPAQASSAPVTAATAPAGPAAVRGAAPAQQPAAVAVTPPTTRPARTSVFGTPVPGGALTDVVGNAANQPAPAQVGSSSAGVNPAIAGPANAARSGVGSVSSAGGGGAGGGGGPAIAAAIPQSTTIAPALADIAAQTRAAAAAAAQATQR